MRLGFLFGAGGRHTTADADAQTATDSTGHVLLGSDGIRYFATVETTPEQAAAVVDDLNAQPDDAWNTFVREAEAAR